METSAPPTPAQPPACAAATPIFTPTPLPTTAGLTTKTQPTPRRRWGSIQRIAPRHRKWINNALRDGLTYNQILDGLKNRGCEDITYKQLRSWKSTGYVDWLAEQICIENKRLHAEAIANAHNKNDKSHRDAVRDVSDFDIALQIHDVIKSCDTAQLRDLLAAKPENFFRLIRAHAVHERNAILRDNAELALKKLKLAQAKEERLNPINTKPEPPKRVGVSPEELERIVRRINL